MPVPMPDRRLPGYSVTCNNCNSHCFQANKSFFGLTLALMMLCRLQSREALRYFRYLLKSIAWKPFLKSKANKCCSKFVRGSPQKSRFCMHKKKSKQDCSTTVKSICIGTQWRNYMTTRTFNTSVFLYILHIYFSCRLQEFHRIP